MTKNTKKSDPTNLVLGLALAGVTTAVCLTPVFEAMAETDTYKAWTAPVAPQPVCVLKVDGKEARVTLYERTSKFSSAYRESQMSGALRAENGEKITIAPGVTGTFKALDSDSAVSSEPLNSDDKDFAPGTYVLQDTKTEMKILGWATISGEKQPAGTCTTTGPGTAPYKQNVLLTTRMPG